MKETAQGYLIFDIGTGNMRVAVVSLNGIIKAIERADIEYQSDPRFPQSLHFDPDFIWKSILQLARKALHRASSVEIVAVTSTSQRQGIVMMDQDGKPSLGFPNIDFRGEEFAKALPDKQSIYEKTGRWPTGLFSGMSLSFVRTYEPELFHKIACFCSISDWITYQLSGILCYEPSQATETLLYDVRKNRWCHELAASLNLPESILPQLLPSGTCLGRILPEQAEELGISPEAKVVVGGADTQVAVKHITSRVGESVIVSGTTTPIVKIVDQFVMDKQARTWTNSHIETGKWLVEGNCGVSGLNYQKIKALFYPNESYGIMEEEIGRIGSANCFACLSTSPIEGVQPQFGGFAFPIPTPPLLTRAHFAWASLWDIACAIYTVWQEMEGITNNQPSYIWGCGGGFQSETLSQMLADLLQKEIRVKQDGRHSSVLGAALICSEAIGLDMPEGEEAYQAILPSDSRDNSDLYEEWSAWRKRLDQR